VSKKGTFARLPLHPITRKRFDLHFLVGLISVPAGHDMQFSESPHVSAAVKKEDFRVAGAAQMQCMCVERFVPETLSAAVLAVHQSSTQLPQMLHGMPTMQDVWSLIRRCEDHVDKRGRAAVLGTTAPNLFRYFSRQPAAIANGAAAGPAAGAAAAPAAAPAAGANGAAAAAPAAASAAATAPAALKFAWANSVALVFGCIYMYIYTYVYICMYSICMHIYICVHIHIYIFIHIYVNI